MYVSFKLCMDVHVMGKGTLANYRSLLSFTNALIIATGSKCKLDADSYSDHFVFLEKAAAAPEFAN